MFFDVLAKQKFENVTISNSTELANKYKITLTTPEGKEIKNLKVTSLNIASNEAENHQLVRAGKGNLTLKKCKYLIEAELI